MKIKKIWMEDVTEVRVLRVDFDNDFHCHFVLDTSNHNSLCHSLMSAARSMLQYAEQIESRADMKGE